MNFIFDNFLCVNTIINIYFYKHLNYIYFDDIKSLT